MKDEENVTRKVDEEIFGSWQKVFYNDFYFRTNQRHVYFNIRLARHEFYNKTSDLRRQDG